MFANLKTVLVALVLTAGATATQAEEMPRVIPGLSPLSALYYGPRNPTPNVPSQAAPRPNYRVALPQPPIEFPPINQFWPRGNDDCLTLVQIATHRNFVWQNYQRALLDPRMPIQVVMAVGRDWQYWSQVYTWKLARESQRFGY